jgi:hypothetical protein
MADPEDQSSEAFRAEVARAFNAISAAMEVMQANVFITRSLINLLHERELLQFADVRERALALAQAAALTPSTMKAMQQLLDECGLAVPQVLQ